MHDQRIPYGCCQCGCGRKTTIQKRSERGLRAGEPARFIRGHQGRRPLEERFWEKVDKRGPSDCWNWTGALGDGYGSFGVATKVIRPAHRVAYELMIGPLPADGHVDHLCRNPSCVNPAHLEHVTHAENVRRGLLARLTMDEAREIRRRSAEGERTVDLARAFSVGWSTVHHILRGDTWREG